MEPIKDFKLLAIRPLPGCNTSLRRVLKSNEVYQLYQDYEFTFENDDKTKDVKRIQSKEKIPENLYAVSPKSIPKLNICAIVGKNGTGKSSIAELLFAGIYNIAYDLKTLPKRDDDGELIRPIKTAKLQLFYLKDETYYKVIILGTSIEYYKQASTDNSFIKIPVPAHSDLFYVLAINYSHYALNSKYLGKWVKSVFHKNDGYQTPVVLNPFRREGIIDINNEEYLTRSRLITNLLTAKENSGQRQITDNKTVKEIIFTLNSRKVKFREIEKPIEAALKEKKSELLDLVFKIIGKVTPPSSYKTKDKNLELAYKYILKKVVSIKRRYKPYRTKDFAFLGLDDDISLKKKNRKILIDIKLFKAFLRKLKTDESHITFKLRQAINFAINIKFYRYYIGRRVQIGRFSEALNKQVVKGELINYIPPSFFDFDLTFEEGGRFNALSSGEKQKAFSSATYIYHLINLNSVKSGEQYNRYEHINIVFDEIELYYHPALQREFINDFITDISRLKLPNIRAINCIFITHSPFLLSDIPKANILCLDIEAKSKYAFSKELPSESFGANIHELLANDFFMQNGFMGLWAKGKIKDLIKAIDELEPESKGNPEIERHIGIIGEPFLRTKLKEMYEDKIHSGPVPRDQQIRSQISEMKNQIKILENELGTYDKDNS
ncbi:MAG: AAA family ATPase [Bacteroidetes bacterium]|nr:AAA family ATPase [Bacteroidota bacterium]